MTVTNMDCVWMPGCSTCDWLYLTRMSSRWADWEMPDCALPAVIYMIEYEEILQWIPVNTCFRSFLWPTLTFPMFAAVEMVTSSFKATCRAFLSKLWLIVEDRLPVIKTTSSIVTFFSSITLLFGEEKTGLECVQLLYWQWTNCSGVCRKFAVIKLAFEFLPGLRLSRENILDDYDSKKRRGLDPACKMDIVDAFGGQIRGLPESVAQLLMSS